MDNLNVYNKGLMEVYLHQRYSFGCMVYIIGFKASACYRFSSPKYFLLKQSSHLELSEC
jgi:hypothetical protein